MTTQASGVMLEEQQKLKGLVDNQVKEIVFNLRKLDLKFPAFFGLQHLKQLTKFNEILSRRVSTVTSLEKSFLFLV
jgi:hypothetical protein